MKIICSRDKSLSVALATYNGQKYIKGQILSILTQTLPPDEIVVSDDCSNDETLSIVTDISLLYKGILVLLENDKNVGYTQNFSKALSACNGDIILLSDQDDIWLPNKIETIYKHIYSYTVPCLYIHDGLLVDEDMNWYGATKLQQTQYISSTSEHFVTGALSGMNRSFLEIALPIPENIYGHDIWIHTLAHVLSVRCISNSVLQLIRRHSSNTSHFMGSRVSPLAKPDIIANFLIPLNIILLERQVIMYRELISRVCDNKAIIVGYLGIDQYQEALSKLRKRYDYISMLLDVCSFLPAKQIPALLYAILFGKYDYTGWRVSCLKAIMHNLVKILEYK